MSETEIEKVNEVIKKKEDMIKQIRTDYYFNGIIPEGYNINEILGFEDIYQNRNNERFGGSRGMEEDEGAVARE